MKRLIFSTAVICATFNLLAETSTFEFTYASPSAKALSATGIGQAGRIDVAMLIDNPAFIGMKITDIKAYINTAEDISSPSVWLSSELSVNSDNYNVPDIMSMEVAPPVDDSFDGEEMASIQGKLTDPYIMTGEPIYVGYTITVDKYDGPGTRYPIIISKVNNSEGFFLHSTSSSYARWNDMSDMGAALIVVTFEREMVDYSVAINNINEVYSLSDEPFKAEVTLSNIGSKPVNNLKYTYSFDNSSNFLSGEYSFDTPFEPDIFGNITIALDLEGVGGLGTHPVNLTIDELNGNPNNSKAASFNFDLMNLSFMPKHRPLVEEYTGLWCGWCPRGYIAMELIAEYYGDDQVSICYHDRDGMAITTNFPVNIGDFPGSTVDRVEVLDPYFGSGSKDMGILDNINGAIAKPAFASIDVEAQLEGDHINVTTTVVFNRDYDQSPYQLGYTLTSNGLSSPGWAQKNYYAGATGLEGTPLEPVAQWPQLVYDLVFNDVVVDVTGAKGIVNSLPFQVKAMETYTHNYTINIGDNKLISDPEMLVVNAFIVNRDNSQVMNANKFRLISEEGGVEGISMDKEVINMEYFNLNGLRVDNPAHGIYICRKHFSDGSTHTSKVVL